MAIRYHRVACPFGRKPCWYRAAREGLLGIRSSRGNYRSGSASGRPRAPKRGSRRFASALGSESRRAPTLQVMALSGLVAILSGFMNNVGALADYSRMVSARSTHRRRLFASHSVVLAVGSVSGPRAWWFHERTHRVLPKPTTLERPQP